MYRLDRCPQGLWELAQMRPAQEVLNHVVRYAGYHEHGCSIANREVATPVVPLILGFGDPFRISLGQGPALACRSFVAGLCDGYADVVSTRRAHCMQVDFTPLGAYRFFGLPMRELAGRIVPVDLLGGFGFLIDQLGDAPEWATRFALLDRFVRHRLAAARAPSAATARVWHALVATSGAARIGALAADIGWSRKHLAQRFAIEVGTTPKAAGRILRFAAVRRAIDADLARGRPIDWADLAHARGYADQPHMIREFRILAGVTPARYLDDRAGRFRPLGGQVTNLQDAH